MGPRDKPEDDKWRGHNKKLSPVVGRGVTFGVSGS